MTLIESIHVERNKIALTAATPTSMCATLTRFTDVCHAKTGYCCTDSVANTIYDL